MDRDATRAELVSIPGIGPKVADCIALFSLDKDDLIPVDTHVRQIYERTYRRSSAKAVTSKTVTPAVYAEIGNVFRDVFGDKAGWAHSVLFAADLFSFRKVMMKGEKGAKEEGEEGAKEQQEGALSAPKGKKRKTPAVKKEENNTSPEDQKVRALASGSGRVDRAKKAKSEVKVEAGEEERLKLEIDPKAKGKGKARGKVGNEEKVKLEPGMEDSKRKKK